MTESQNLETQSKNTLASKKILEDKIESDAYQNILSMNIIASGDMEKSSSNLDSIKQGCHNGITSLVKGESLQNMLAAQMLSLHQLQQTSMFMANRASDHENKQYYTNSSIKLANAFTQQAALLAKLQGGSVHKIVVERVEVHSGGQAVVGDINTGKQ